jgi:hypothetical protein
MVVIGYSRKWLHRPEVNIRIPRAALEQFSPRARHMLRNNPVVESLDTPEEIEVYQSFAYYPSPQDKPLRHAAILLHGLGTPCPCRRYPISYFAACVGQVIGPLLSLRRLFATLVLVLLPFAAITPLLARPTLHACCLRNKSTCCPPKDHHNSSHSGCCENCACAPASSLHFAPAHQSLISRPPAPYRVVPQPAFSTASCQRTTASERAPPKSS